MNSNYYTTGLVLSRPSLDKPFAWMPVRGIKWSSPRPEWRDIKFFIYRDGRLVIAADAATGVALIYAPSVPVARTRMQSFLRQMTRSNYAAQVLYSFTHAIEQAGPRPEVQHVSLLTP